MVYVVKAVFLSIIMLFFVFSPSVFSASKDPDLIFYFPFEKFDGNTALDMSGNGHNGDIKGNIKVVDGGKFGKCAQFEKTAYIDLHGPDFPDDQIPKSAITLCAWIKCQNTGDHHEIFNARASDSTWLIHPEARSDGNNFRWLLRTDGGTTIFDMRAGAVTWDSWQHFAGVYDGKKGILYINGENVGEANGGAKIAKDWGSGARIGRTIDDARPFTGLMDELIMWKKALTRDEIRAIMEKGYEAFMAVSPVGSISTTWGQLKSQ